MSYIAGSTVKRSRTHCVSLRSSSKSRALLCAGGPVSPDASLTLLSRCSLGSNQIGDKGGAALAEALKSNQTLTSLE
jgi:hypothetical protein